VKDQEEGVRETAIRALNNAFVQRFHSLAQYILDSGIYVTEGDARFLEQLRGIAAYDLTEAGRIAEVIEQLDGIPQVTPYDHGVAELNYLSSSYLRTVLIDALSAQCARYQVDLGLVKECAPAFQAFVDLCQALTRQIAVLSAPVA
jgi:bacterioferritin (cytochrome b1)